MQASFVCMCECLWQKEKTERIASFYCSLAALHFFFFFFEIKVSLFFCCKNVLLAGYITLYVAACKMKLLCFICTVLMN